MTLNRGKKGKVYRGGLRGEKRRGNYASQKHTNKKQPNPIQIHTEN